MCAVEMIGGVTVWQEFTDVCHCAIGSQAFNLARPRKQNIMDIYHAWFDLKPGVSDIEFSQRLASYMDSLKASGQMQSWRLTRRKLGLAPASNGDFHLMMEFKDLAQLDAAFNRVGSRREPIESLHFGV